MLALVFAVALVMIVIAFVNNRRGVCGDRDRGRPGRGRPHAWPLARTPTLASRLFTDGERAYATGPGIPPSASPPASPPRRRCSRPWAWGSVPPTGTTSRWCGPRRAPPRCGSPAGPWPWPTTPASPAGSSPSPTPTAPPKPSPSPVVTGVIGAAFSLAMAFLAPAFGTYVDRHPKHRAMVAATTTSTASFALATVLFLLVDAPALLSLRSVWFWVFVVLILLGSVAGGLRGIALSTCVTILVPADRRDRANGLVGAVTGVSFAITSVFSGLAIGQLGMGWALYGSLALTVVALLHLQTIHIDEPTPARGDGHQPHVDVRGAIDCHPRRSPACSG
jgi:hypothetical protein